MCDDCKCECDKPKKDSLSHYSDERLATAYRGLRDASSKYGDELYARGYKFELATSRGFFPVKASGYEFRWRKSEEIILT